MIFSSSEKSEWKSIAKRVITSVGKVLKEKYLSTVLKYIIKYLSMSTELCWILIT